MKVYWNEWIGNMAEIGTVKQKGGFLFKKDIVRKDTIFQGINSTNPPLFFCNSDFFSLNTITDVMQYERSMFLTGLFYKRL